jgi:hypothetical protein
MLFQQFSTQLVHENYLVDTHIHTHIHTHTHTHTHTHPNTEALPHIMVKLESLE